MLLQFRQSACQQSLGVTVFRMLMQFQFPADQLSIRIMAGISMSMRRNIGKRTAKFLITVIAVIIMHMNGISSITFSGWRFIAAVEPPNLLKFS